MIPAALATATLGLLTACPWAAHRWRHRGRRYELAALHAQLCVTQDQRNFLAGLIQAHQTCEHRLAAERDRAGAERDALKASLDDCRLVAAGHLRTVWALERDNSALRQRVYAVDELAAKRVVRLANGRFAPKEDALGEARAAVAEAREALAVVDGAP